MSVHQDNYSHGRQALDFCSFQLRYNWCPEEISSLREILFYEGKCLTTAWFSVGTNWRCGRWKGRIFHWEAPSSLEISGQGQTRTTGSFDGNWICADDCASYSSSAGTTSPHSWSSLYNLDWQSVYKLHYSLYSLSLVVVKMVLRRMNARFPCTDAKFKPVSYSYIFTCWCLIKVESVWQPNLDKSRSKGPHYRVLFIAVVSLSSALPLVALTTQVIETNLACDAILYDCSEIILRAAGTLFLLPNASFKLHHAKVLQSFLVAQLVVICRSMWGKITWSICNFEPYYAEVQRFYCHDCKKTDLKKRVCL